MQNLTKKQMLLRWRSSRMHRLWKRILRSAEAARCASLKSTQSSIKSSASPLTQHIKFKTSKYPRLGGRSARRVHRGSSTWTTLWACPYIKTTDSTHTLTPSAYRHNTEARRSRKRPRNNPDTTSTRDLTAVFLSALRYRRGMKTNREHLRKQITRLIRRFRRR